MATVPATSTTRALSGPAGRAVAAHRDELRQVFIRHGATNPRIFGSVARGDDRADSDVDVLVDLPSGFGLFALGRLADELERILGLRVDLVPESDLRPSVRAEVERDLVAL